MAAATLTRFQVGSLLARAVPRPLLPVAADAAGALGMRFAPDAAAMFAHHLARVDPSLSPTECAAGARAGVDSYARYWIETLRIGSLSDRVIDAGFRAEGYHRHVVDGLAAGNGVILALPHLGGWEWAGRWLAQRGHRISAVVERLEPPEVYDWFVALRERVGINVVPLGPDSGRAILAALKRNEIVALMCDRDLGRNGVAVEFFGAPTTLPAGPVLLSLRTGAPVLPTAVYFTDSPDGHIAVVGAPLEIDRGAGRRRDAIASGTQMLANRIEELIRRAPEQWHLFQPNWPDDPGYFDANPAVATPAVAIADASNRAVATPDVSTPDVSTPAVATPDVSTPDVSTPAGAGRNGNRRR